MTYEMKEENKIKIITLTVVDYIFTVFNRTLNKIE